MATRAKVTPRLTNSAPVLACANMTCSTSGGGGSFAPPTSSEAIHQVAKNTATDTRRIGSVSGYAVIESTGIELRRGPDQLTSADLCQHAIEHARVFLLVGDRPVWNPGAVAIAIGVQRRGIGSASQGLDLVPISVGGCENIL